MKTFKKILFACVIIAIVSLVCIGGVNADEYEYGTVLEIDQAEGGFNNTITLKITATDRVVDNYEYEWYELNDFGEWSKMGDSVLAEYYVTINDVSSKTHHYKAYVNGRLGESNQVTYLSYTSPHAFLIGNSDSGTEHTDIRFTVQSDSPVREYLWDFGDGNTSTDESPVHQYENAGDYTYTVVIANEFGYDSATGYITVNALKNKTFFDITTKMDLKSGSAMNIFVIMMLVFAGLFVFYVIATKGHISMPLLVGFMLVIAVAFVIIIVGGTFSGISLSRFG